MISRTLARKRHVVAASAERNTIFSHMSCSMSSESFQSIFDFARSSANALGSGRLRLVALAEDQALQRIAVNPVPSFFSIA
jgi:hypothetical protein